MNQDWNSKRNLLMQTELYTKDKSRMETSDMAMVSKYGQMEANTKDTGKME